MFLITTFLITTFVIITLIKAVHKSDVTKMTLLLKALLIIRQ